MFTPIALIALFFLIGSSTLTALSTALHRKGRLQAEEALKQEHSPFFFRHFLNFFFGKQKWEGLLFSLSFTKHLLRIAYVLTAFFFLIEQEFFRDALVQTSSSRLVFDSVLILSIAILIVAFSLVFDFLFSLFGQLRPDQHLRYLSPLGSLFLLLCMPLTAPFFRVLKLFLPKLGKEKKFSPTFKIRDKVL